MGTTKSDMEFRLLFRRMPYTISSFLLAIFGCVIVGGIWAMSSSIGIMQNKEYFLLAGMWIVSCMVSMILCMAADIPEAGKAVIFKRFSTIRVVTAVVMLVASAVTLLILKNSYGFILAGRAGWISAFLYVFGIYFLLSHTMYGIAYCLAAKVK